MHAMALARTIRRAPWAGTWALVSLLAIPAAAPVATSGCTKAPTAAGDAGAGPSNDGPPPLNDSSIKIDLSFGGAADATPPGSNNSDAKPPDSCGSLRNCVTNCKHDSACEQRCVVAAPAAARTEYTMITTCSSKGCTSDDEVCRCQRECNPQGECSELVVTCRGFEPDDFFCDNNCR